MSSSTRPTSTDDGPTPSSGDVGRDRAVDDAGSRINPLNWPDHLKQYPRDDPDRPGGREVQNPHTWDDPDPGLLERAAPETAAGWILATAGLLVNLGLLAYLLPIFGSIWFNPLGIGLTVAVVGVGAVYLKGRADGVEALRDLDVNVRYYGDDADIVPVEEVGESGPETLVEVIRDWRWTGFKVRKLLKRDLGYDPASLRSYPGEEVGDKPAVDRLNATTVEAHTDTLGTFYVTHAADVVHDETAQDSDRWTTLPNRMDDDVVDDMSRLLTQLNRKIQSLEADVEELERAADDARDLRDKQLAPELEQSLNIIAALQDSLDDSSNGSSSTTVREESSSIEAIREAANAGEEANGGGGT